MKEILTSVDMAEIVSICRRSEDWSPHDFPNNYAFWYLEEKVSSMIEEDFDRNDLPLKEEHLYACAFMYIWEHGKLNKKVGKDELLRIAVFIDRARRAAKESVIMCDMYISMLRKQIEPSC